MLDPSPDRAKSCTFNVLMPRSTLGSHDLADLAKCWAAMPLNDIPPFGVTLMIPE